MALQEMNFTFESSGAEAPPNIPKEWSHTGVVGSGDMEVLIRREDAAELKGKVKVKVTSPVSGYDDIWEKVLKKFVLESGLSGVSIEINDNNSTPFIVGMRLKQALMEAQ